MGQWWPVTPARKVYDFNQKDCVSEFFIEKKTVAVFIFAPHDGAITHHFHRCLSFVSWASKNLQDKSLVGPPVRFIGVMMSTRRSSQTWWKKPLFHEDQHIPLRSQRITWHACHETRPRRKPWPWLPTPPGSNAAIRSRKHWKIWRPTASNYNATGKYMEIMIIYDLFPICFR